MPPARQRNDALHQCSVGREYQIRTAEGHRHMLRPSHARPPALV